MSAMEDLQASPTTVLWLAPKSRLAERLAGPFEVVAERPAGGIAGCVLAAGDRAGEALRAALADPDRIAAVVLLAPPAVAALEPDLAAHLHEIETPVLALFGTEDTASPPAFGHDWRRALPKGFQTFVYGAGADMANERPDAVATLVTDFFGRGDRFIVKVTDGKLYD